MSKGIRLRVGVGVFIQDSEGRVLLEHRRDCGLWSLPGGNVEPGESVKEAAIREVKEETGFDVQVTDLVGIYSDPTERIVTYSDAGTFQLVDVIVYAKILKGVLTCSSESFEVRFYSQEDLPGILPRAKKPIQDGFTGVKGVMR